MESAVLDLLVGKISSIIATEASLIGGVSDELDELKLELISMKSFIQDADKMNGLTERQKAWVASVIDMCYPVEDIIDEFMYHMNKKLKDGKSPKFLKRIIHLPKNLWMRHRLAKKIQEINRKLKSIPERNQRYDPLIAGTKADDDRDEDQRRAQNQSESLVHAKADHVVGIHEDERLLEEWLTKGERELTIISIVGMGGSGKSTLAAKVYNSPIVKRSFDCCAWITVSQTYNIDDLLKSMIKEFHGSQKVGVPVDLSSLRYKDLLELILDYLKRKRYVVVLDDVWNVKLREDIKFSLPDEGHGSRVILTTRDEKIADAFCGVGRHIHRIKPLKQKEAWELFCATAFVSNPNRTCPQELKNIAHEVLLKCEGLPLAILALGGALSSKKEVSEWVHFSSSLNYELSNNDDLEEVKKRILLFSFKNLSYQLKRCFLYCCIFPEDYPIGRNRLIRLWMAEGFVEQVRSKTPELMADDYLVELIQRNMLQVVRRNASGRPKTCKMHDMMRELAVSMSKKENFCFVNDGQEEIGGSTRRLSIHNAMVKDEKITFNCSISRLRSLFVFVSDAVKPSSPAAILPPGFRFLRVLDLKNLPIDKLPDELVNLFNLRYLNLRRTNVKELPKSIGKLRNLQTLDTRDSKIEELPAGIVKLENLRHLMVYRYTKNFSQFFFVLGIPAPLNMYKLRNLQVFSCVEAEPGLMKELKNMTQLTRIGISKVRKEDEEDLCTAIRGMNLLHYLFLMATNEDEILRINALPSAPPCLETLVLVGKLEKVPPWFHSLQSLTQLSLHSSRLSEDPIPRIQTLANLGQLALNNAYTGDPLCFSTGFNKLTVLYIQNLPQLKKIIIKKGAMPGLLTMRLHNCMELKMVPHGIEHLTELQELTIYLVSTQLVDRLRGEESVDRPRVRQIPKINHFYQSSNALALESLSRFDLYEGPDD